MKRLVMLLLLIGSLVTSIPGQTRLGPHAAQIRKLDFLLGRWSGESWFEGAPGQRFPVRSNETVETRLGGTLLLVEGLHRGRIGGRGEEVTVHHAFALISYDEQKQRYRLEAFLLDGRYIETEARVTEGRLQWGFHDPQRGHLRYTITIDNEGRWNEIGEMSSDGKSWRQFFQMILKREA